MKTDTSKTYITQFKITLYNDFNEPCYCSTYKNNVRHIMTDQYLTTSVEQCLDIIRNFIDPPDHKLTLKDIHNEFDISNDKHISDSVAKSIQYYYNGRLKLFKQIVNDFKLALKGLKTPKIIRYDIPFALNYFSCEPDNDNANTSQVTAYIEIEMTYI